MLATLDDILAMVAELAAEQAGLPRNDIRQAIAGRLESVMRDDGSNWFLDYETQNARIRDALIAVVPIVRRLYPIAQPAQPSA